MASSQKLDICDLCDKPINSDHMNITERGLPHILQISAELKDGVDKKILRKKCPICTHMSCKKNYIKPSNVKKRKLQLNELDNAENRKIACRSDCSTFHFLWKAHGQRWFACTMESTWTW